PAGRAAVAGRGLLAAAPAAARAAPAHEGRGAEQWPEPRPAGAYADAGAAKAQPQRAHSAPGGRFGEARQARGPPRPLGAAQNHGARKGQRHHAPRRATRYLQPRPKPAHRRPAGHLPALAGLLSGAGVVHRFGPLEAQPGRWPAARVAAAQQAGARRAPARLGRPAPAPARHGHVPGAGRPRLHAEPGYEPHPRHGGGTGGSPGPGRNAAARGRCLQRGRYRPGAAAAGSTA
nr:hypothetical protein [Tanacetum cinerariifolium]